MLNDPRDPVAYRIAIAALGLAVAVVFAGICWIIGLGRAKSVPHELWFAGVAIAGVFVGALIPFSLKVRSSCSNCTPEHDINSPAWASILGALFLLLICGAAAGTGAGIDSLPLEMLGVAIAGVLLGLPIPSPAQRDR